MRYLLFLNENNLKFKIVEAKYSGFDIDKFVKQKLALHTTYNSKKMNLFDINTH